MRIVVVFPAPFGPEEAEDLAPLDAERDVVDGRDAAVALREVLDLDHVMSPLIGRSQPLDVLRPPHPARPGRAAAGARTVTALCIDQAGRAFTGFVQVRFPY